MTSPSCHTRCAVRLGHRCPITKIRDTRKEEIASAGEEIARHGEKEKIACLAYIAAAEEQQPKNQGEKKVHESAVRGHPSRLNIALQGHRAHRHLPRSTQPRRHAMPQPLVQNILENQAKTETAITVSRSSSAEPSLVDITPLITLYIAVVPAKLPAGIDLSGVRLPWEKMVPAEPAL